MSTSVSSASLYPRLLADIGGTNARFAWIDSAGAPLSHCETYRCGEPASIAEALAAYLRANDLAVPAAMSLGIANPIQGDWIEMTNGAWSFSIQSLKEHFGLKRLSVINDFAALALGIPDLKPHELHELIPGEAQSGAPIAVLGAGTGLGVAGLLPLQDGAWYPISGEGGHTTHAATDDLEEAVITQLRQRFGHASAERALSGPGLVNLYQISAELAGRQALALTPSQVVERHEAGDPDAQRAIDLFCAFLGSVAGNLALTLGARGGVFIGGGIAPRLLDSLRRPLFRTRFEAKGRLRGYLSSIPCHVIHANVSPALPGAARALDLGL